MSEGTLCKLPHHTAVEILLHLAEGVWRCLSLARDDDADVSDGQGGVRLALGCPTVGDVDALRGISANVCWTPRGCSLDEVATLFQSLFPLIEHAVGEERGSQPTQLHINV